jgi:ATP-dependent DNA ligase
VRKATLASALAKGKRRDLPYRSGRSKCWVKLKNPASPAMLRVLDETW